MTRPGISKRCGPVISHNFGACVTGHQIDPCTVLAYGSGSICGNAVYPRVDLGGSRGGTLEQDGEPLREIAPGEHVGYASVR